jgi:H2-forming N5,N10-methylenetetrahydromethanopterin dehydrogenase-like enzyme
MRSLAEYGICQDEPLDTRCASELDTLIRINPFSKYTVDMILELIDHAQAAAVIHSTAPT